MREHVIRWANWRQDYKPILRVNAAGQYRVAVHVQRPTGEPKLNAAELADLADEIMALLSTDCGEAKLTDITQGVSREPQVILRIKEAWE